MLLIRKCSQKKIAEVMENGSGKGRRLCNEAHREGPVQAHGNILKTVEIVAQSCPQEGARTLSINIHLHVGLWLRAIAGVWGMSPRAFFAVLRHRAKHIPAA